MFKKLVVTLMAEDGSGASASLNGTHQFEVEPDGFGQFDVLLPGMTVTFIYHAERDGIDWGLLSVFATFASKELLQKAYRLLKVHERYWSSTDDESDSDQVER